MSKWQVSYILKNMQWTEFWSKKSREKEVTESMNGDNSTRTSVSTFRKNWEGKGKYLTKTDKLNAKLFALRRKQELKILNLADNKIWDHQKSEGDKK